MKIDNTMAISLNYRSIRSALFGRPINTNRKYPRYSVIAVSTVVFLVTFMEQSKSTAAVSPEYVTLEGLGPEIPKEIVAVIKEVLAKSNIEKARATSLTRTTRQQAEEMLRIAEVSIPKAKRLYCAPGDAVIDVYAKNKSKPRSQVLSMMEAELKRQLPTAQNEGCLNHIASSSYIAVDIAKSSIPEEKSIAFMKAVRARKEISGFICPPKDPRAYHIEFPRNENDRGKGLVRDLCQ